jgi:diacylglycerol kinase (ATP)
MGLRKMVNRKSCKDLHRMIKVEVDGKYINLPPVEGIIILNILRYVNILDKDTSRINCLVL